MTVLVCLLALSVSAGATDWGLSPSKRWLPLLEISRLFRPAPQTVLMFAPGLAAESATALRRASEGKGFEVELAPPPSESAPAATPLPRLDDRIIALVLRGDVDWDAAASALAASGAYGPTTLLALSGPGDSPEARVRLLKTARKHDMAATDLRGRSPGDAGIALAEALMALGAPHPVLIALPLFPLMSLALFWLRHRSRNRHNS